jgi:hypothetical protein
MKHKRKAKTKKIKRVFKAKDFISGDGMVVSLWGPAMWHSLHTISFNYPIHPTDEDKKNYKEFMTSLTHVLPCKYCRENLVKNYKILPMTNERMKNRDSFSRYVYLLHELVNKNLGKKSGLTYCDVRERYEHFRSRCTGTEKTKSLKKTNPNNKTKKEKGCTESLYGKKAKCIIKIVPKNTKCKTFQMDHTCKKKSVDL